MNGGRNCPLHVASFSLLIHTCTVYFSIIIALQGMSLAMLLRHVRGFHHHLMHSHVYSNIRIWSGISSCTRQNEHGETAPDYLGTYALFLPRHHCHLLYTTTTHKPHNHALNPVTLSRNKIGKHQHPNKHDQNPIELSSTVRSLIRLY